MFSESIKYIWLKGTSDSYPDDYPILQTNAECYEISPCGFRLLNNPDLTEYRVYSKNNLTGLVILEVFSNVMDLYIRLSNDSLVQVSAGGDDLWFGVDGSELYYEIRDFLLNQGDERDEENGMVKLSAERTFA